LNKNFLLSLDFSGQKMLGPNQLFANPALWPDRLIIMTLDRVGSGKGPDLAKLTAFKQAHPKKRFLAAGGIRNLHDLKALEAIGVEGALIASALHAGAITSDNIRKLGWSGY
jgi:phosphoribosylformimino-5-aminoimidazole carboxamide ribotide isomerase